MHGSAEKIAALVRELEEVRAASERPHPPRPRISLFAFDAICIATAGILSIRSPGLGFAAFLAALLLSSILHSLSRAPAPRRQQPIARQIEIAHELIRSDSVQAIGPLIGILLPADGNDGRGPGGVFRSMPEDQRRRVVAGLMVLLWRVTDADRSQLDRVYRLSECICHSHTTYAWGLMGTARDDLLVAMLHAVGEVGAIEEARSAVSYMLFDNGEMHGKRVSDIVQDAGYACLARLRERAEAALPAQTLLRAAGNPTEEAGSGLLRPSPSLGPAESEDYLRPSSPE